MIAAKMAMIAMTTSNSMSVKARHPVFNGISLQKVRRFICRNDGIPFKGLLILLTTYSIAHSRLMCIPIFGEATETRALSAEN
jgi:hypothetical protein